MVSIPRPPLDYSRSSFASPLFSSRRLLERTFRPYCIVSFAPQTRNSSTPLMSLYLTRVFAPRTWREKEFSHTVFGYHSNPGHGIAVCVLTTPTADFLAPERTFRAVFTPLPSSATTLQAREMLTWLGFWRATPFEFFWR